MKFENESTTAANLNVHVMKMINTVNISQLNLIGIIINGDNGHNLLKTRP